MAATQLRYCVTVLVLGDLGRSPRMVNHALALAADGAKVWLAGYCETPIERTVLEHPRIQVCSIKAIARAGDDISGFRFLLISAFRAGFLWFQLLWLLFARTPRGGAILVQNPPSLPTLPVAWLAARLMGSRFIIDWHNFGYAMLGLRLGTNHFAVRATKCCERLFGRRADAHFCVSRAMHDTLVRDFSLVAPIVLYDRPREMLPLVPISSRGREGCALAVCPTSWTADEDMDLLLRGLQQWDIAPAPSPDVRLLVVITGRGPLRDSFEQRLSAISWQRVQVRTAFLDPLDYRQLLCAAHFGISMHRSSSGLDLPMKVIDMFGARTPVCALDYGPCLAEQVQCGVTGVLFRSSQELALRIAELLQGFPGEMPFLKHLQQGIQASSMETWEQAWRRQAAQVLRGDVGAGQG